MSAPALGHRLPGGERRIVGPGVSVLAPTQRGGPQPEAALGTVAYLGYAGDRLGQGWPVRIDEPEDIPLRLELPPWGLLKDALLTHFRNGGARCFVVGLPPDRPHDAALLLGGGPPGARHGLMALAVHESAELLAAPDLFRIPPDVPAPSLAVPLEAQRALLAFAAGIRQGTLGGCFALLDVPPSLSEAQVARYARALRQGPLGEFGAAYHPWLLVDTPGRGLTLLPPSAAIAGQLSALSSLSAAAPLSQDRGPHLVAANIPIQGVISCEAHLSRAAAARLLEAGVNPILPVPPRGLVAWGARTLSPDLERQHISARRVLSFVRRRIHAGTAWAVFEPNEPTLWLRLSTYVSGFMQRIWRLGLLAGESAEAAFTVRCDGALNPTREVDSGRLHISVALRPARSVEHVVIHISHARARSSSDTGEEG